MTYWFFQRPIDKRSKRPHGQGKLLPQHCEKTKRNVMAAIMQTAGPVSTPATIRQNWKFLNNATANDFVEAAQSLEEMGLGEHKNVLLSRGLPSKVFIKRKPEEALEVLSANPDLCDFKTYSKRYARSPTVSVGLSLRSKLVAMKLVAPKQMM